MELTHPLQDHRQGSKVRAASNYWDVFLVHRKNKFQTLEAALPDQQECVIDVATKAVWDPSVAHRALHVLRSLLVLFVMFR